ncbi:hypothetical protein B0H67DRAFT_499020 [Lasiosphaeris hirsuta]|uniref:Myb-like domain-containing protein n=1 Tax=Lasiosphaeris hirsuta TaxID=260670 RepID=A0AA40DMC5_9PEZI|nr:hypothetical protein B0H67DRAFT_499020 [Lasiosphaeris hirsuta]
MNKNWNDRADKDLFFTILSVKNIGVISGSEWTTIGNHMRTLGYGFTNEGCRQHFQGLRRAQNKAEANGVSNENNPRKADPTQNPITRRPGPGRGRPRKQPAVAPVEGGTPGDPSLVGVPGIPDLSGVAGGSDISGLSDTQGIETGQSGSQPPPPIASSLSTQADTPVADDLAVDPSLEDADADDEHAAKRPRLDENPSLDDEAVMNALAAHNDPSSGNPYVPE